MQALLDVIIPVFLVIGFGYVAVWRGLFSTDAVDGLMKYAQNFAIPCLLFNAISTMDLGATFQAPLLISFYSGAFAAFVIGFVGAHYVFGRSVEDAVAIAFCCLFSNSVMLGLSVTERAYGVDALAANFAIVASPSPFCYGIGITAMEIARNRQSGGIAMAKNVTRAMFSNALVLGIAAGFIVNLAGLSLPSMVTPALDMVVRTALPVALFGMGGVLYQYRPEGDMGPILMVALISLVIHPSITWGVGSATSLSTAEMRSAVLTSAMAPGINTYIFANMYGRAKRVAASAVLISSALSILTAAWWLNMLP